MKPQTLGEAVAQNGVPMVFDLIVTLAEQRGRIPVGQWDIVPAEDWRLRVNGTRDDWAGIPPWSALIEHHGWPMMMVDPGGGTVIGHGSEDACIAMLQDALAKAVKA